MDNQDKYQPFRKFIERNIHMDDLYISTSMPDEAHPIRSDI